MDVLSQDLLLDVTGGEDVFYSETTIRFRSLSEDATAHVDLQAASVDKVTVNGTPLDLDSAYPGGGRRRLELTGLAGENTLTVGSHFAYARTGGGLYRSGGPADGTACTYSRTYPNGASRIFGCFDRRDVRAPITLAVKAPGGWSCLANAPAVSRPAGSRAGWWRFAPTPPLPACDFSVCAGPYAKVQRSHLRSQRRTIPISLYLAPGIDARLAEQLPVELATQALGYFAHVLQTPYPYDKCDVVVVPDYPVLAHFFPGLINIRSQVLTGDESPWYRAMVIVHELAHSWFGGLVDVLEPRDTWLVEALTTYLARLAIPHLVPGVSPWATPTSAGLPDHGYAPDAATIRSLETLIGRRAVLDGIRTLLFRHAHSSATSADLVGYWSTAAGRDLRRWATRVLVPTDRRREPPQT